MSGGGAGMSGDGSVTSGGWRGTSGAGGGGRRRVWLIGCGVIAALLAVNLVVDAQSLIDEHARVGSDIPTWMPWTWEASSIVGWIVAMPLIALAAIRLRPPRLGWPVTIGAHLLLTVAVSMLHVGVMVAIRKLVHGAMGDVYRFGDDLAAVLLYEWRKDALDYVTIAAAFVVIDWLARRADAAPATAAAAAPPRIEVRDGSRTIWLAPEDILWAEAAGNYVELHSATGPLLHRTTLAALERELAPHGFARIHRSRLVRRAAVRAIETNVSGDFDAMMSDGARVGGSRRYRGNLA
ncbi:MAG: LytTR family DNA-binding domain-containing protein [Sphingomonadaceae bacterium]|nr:LytTR family DNA-binding domain-containing protein [Sphingomonadaceae bacterium]